MKPTDEIGVLATAIDTYADLIEQRTDNLVASLRRQYRENAHLTAIIESLADGLIVLDIDGRVLMMNSAARRLIGGMKTIRTASLNQLTAAMTDTLGPALAPGLYSLGDPTRLIHNEKMLQAQAAAIVAISGKRLGTVITLRDVTSEIQTQQQQEALLEKLSQEIQLPMAHIAQDAALEAVDIQRQKTTKESEGDSLLNFAREIARNARAMQRIVAELREVSILSPSEIAHNQSPFLLSELLWNVAAQWKPIAAAVDIDIELEVPDNASYILGDERRLRWALGNIVDNAIKYSLPTNKIKIIGREDKNDMVYIAIIDDGVGIQPEDLPNIFQRFYRGKPMASDGSTITTPGTGQGLYLARHVIRAHGGEIQVKSLPRVGTTVQVKLPLTSSVAFDIGVQQSHQNPTQQGVQDKVESDIANRRNHQTG
jgi:signal transduction histidine kinase